MRLGLTWKKISEEIGAGSMMFTSAALMGDHNLMPAEAAKASKLLGLSDEDARALSTIPTTRGTAAPTPPTGPLGYRLYEVVLGYGAILRAKPRRDRWRQRAARAHSWRGRLFLTGRRWLQLLLTDRLGSPHTATSAARESRA